MTMLIEGWAEEADDYGEMMQISAENEVNIPRRSRRQIPRTLVSERVRSAIEEIRVMRTRTIRRIVSSSEVKPSSIGNDKYQTFGLASFLGAKLKSLDLSHSSSISFFCKMSK